MVLQTLHSAYDSPEDELTVYDLMISPVPLQLFHVPGPAEEKV